MQEDKDLLIKELKEKLDWYTLEASDEEYDEKAVESILYLLDRADPIEEKIPRQEEAWERFKERVSGGEEEFLPLAETGEPGETGTEASGPKIYRFRKASMGEKRAVETVGGSGGGTGGGAFTKALPRKSIVLRIGQFAMRHKFIAAAFLVVVILGASGAARTIATGDPGFFYWLKQDDSGVTMMTSPEGMDAVSDSNVQIYRNKEEMPEWAGDWLEIEEKFEMPEGYEWQYYNVIEFQYKRCIDSSYCNEKKEISLGAWLYQDEVSYHEEGFADYNYVDSYEIAEQQMKVYCKEEESGKIYYIVSFYVENGQFYIRGQDNLEELKVLTEEYLACVKN